MNGLRVTALRSQATESTPIRRPNIVEGGVLPVADLGRGIDLREIVLSSRAIVVSDFDNLPRTLKESDMKGIGRRRQVRDLLDG
ncbi:MAG: hypothetical protein OXI87_04055 [Albidovulum sp.]|nr:hypothetical protein [Albidovulum sp.]MDE0530569.1 hypothetical protein [Albidovulum sp.]